MTTERLMTSMNTELLALLEKDARLTPAQLATMLGRNEQSVTDEIAYCEKNHIILGYPALIDWTKTDDELVTALIEVRISPQRGDGFDRIAERIYQYEEVESLYLMSGAYDLAVTITGFMLLIPDSHWETVFFFTPSLSANSCCVRRSSCRMAFRRSFMLFLLVRCSINQNARTNQAPLFFA